MSCLKSGSVIAGTEERKSVGVTQPNLSNFILKDGRLKRFFISWQDCTVFGPNQGSGFAIV